jgi:hypothetical protein
MGANLFAIGTKRRTAMANSACETIRLGSDSAKRGVNVQVVSNGQSLEATCAAMVAMYYWALWHNAVPANGKMSADGYVVEVWHV